MKPSQLATFLTSAIQNRINVLVTGEPGVGKSDVTAQSARAASADLLISHLVTWDPSDPRGLPWPDASKSSANFLPFGDLKRALDATEPLVWFFDDIGQAAPAVQASCMQLLLARRIGEHKLPDCVTMLAATNRRTDRAGVTGILEPVKSRFATIVGLEADLDDWITWANRAGIRPELIAFLRFKPDLLSDFQPTADLTQSPSPRTWAHANKLLDIGLPSDILTETLIGAVGEGAAGELLTFLELYAALPNIEDALRDPDNAPIPEEPSQLYAVTAALAHRAELATCPALMTYATRMHAASKGEFAAFLVRDMMQRCPDIQDTAEFIAFAAGPFAEIIHG